MGCVCSREKMHCLPVVLDVLSRGEGGGGGRPC